MPSTVHSIIWKLIVYWSTGPGPWPGLMQYEWAFIPHHTRPPCPGHVQTYSTCTETMQDILNLFTMMHRLSSSERLAFEWNTFLLKNIFAFCREYKTIYSVSQRKHERFFFDFKKIYNGQWICDARMLWQLWYIQTFLFPVPLIDHGLLKIKRLEDLQHEKVSLILPF